MVVLHLDPPLLTSNPILCQRKKNLGGYTSFSLSPPWDSCYSSFSLSLASSTARRGEGQRDSSAGGTLALQVYPNLILGFT